jgi:hypothetical protein
MPRDCNNYLENAIKISKMTQILHAKVIMANILSIEVFTNRNSVRK